MIKEIAAAEIFKLKGLFETIIREMNGDLTADEAVVNVHRACSAGYMKVFVDSINSPNHCLVISHLPGMVHTGFSAVITMMYSSPQHRTVEAKQALFRMAYEYADKNRCDRLIGSAWKYKGARGIDSVWLSEGFELQENVYVKLLR